MQNLWLQHTTYAKPMVQSHEHIEAYAPRTRSEAQHKSDILNLQDAAEDVAVNSTERDSCSTSTQNTNSLEHGPFQTS
jgi:hypothetical protein